MDTHCRKCGQEYTSGGDISHSCFIMSDKPSEPLIGWMIFEECCEDMSQWDGVISYPDPTGANLAWEAPIKMIEKSAYDALKAEQQKDEAGMREFQFKFIAADHELRRITAERDSIIQSLTEAKRQRDEFNVERDRYRAALERIASPHCDYDLSRSVDCAEADWFKEALGIAREALKLLDAKGSD